jgi:Domain of unknown function (DUF4157)
MRTFAGKGDFVLQERTTPSAPAPAHPAGHAILELQRTIGNRAVGELLHANADGVSGSVEPYPFQTAIRRADSSAEQQVRTPQSSGDRDQNGVAAEELQPSVREVLRSPGQPLDSAVRARLEAHLGASLDRVTVHAGGTSGASARSVDALAYTVGNHIVFGDGQYRPGTPVGDMLLAHEAAHVAQQSGKNSRSSHDDGRLENEANAAALSFAFSFGALKARTAAAVRSGIRLQRCPISSAKRINPPSFFGPASRDTLDTINRIMESGASLSNWISYGTIVTSFEDPIAAMHSAEAAEAMKSIPGIVRARAGEEIDLLLVTHDKDLNQEEKAFWNNLRSRLAGQ